MFLLGPTAGAWAVPPPAPPPTADAARQGAATTMASAMRDLASGALDAATNEFGEAAKADPTAPGPLLGLAEVALRRNHAAAAEADIKAAITRSPRSVLAHAALARLYVRQNDLNGALTEFDAAIALNPRDPTLPLARGDVLALALGRPVEAIAAYRQAIRVDGSYGPAHYELGRVLARTGNLLEARAELRLAVQFAPENAMARSALANAQLRLHDPAAAIATYDGALKIAPALMEAQIGRADALAAAGRGAEALTAYGMAGAVDGTSALALVRRGVLLQGMGRSGEAIRDFRAATAVDPKDPDAQNDLAYVLADTGGNLDQSLDAAKQAVAIAPDVALYKDTLAWVYRARGDLPASLRILQPLAATSKEPVIDYHLGVVYRAQGRTALANAAFTAALQLDPDFKPARDALR